MIESAFLYLSLISAMDFEYFGPCLVALNRRVIVIPVKGELVFIWKVSSFRQTSATGRV